MGVKEMAIALICLVLLADDPIVTKDELAQYLATTGKQRAKDELQSLARSYQQHIDIQKSLTADRRKQRSEIDRLTKKLKEITDKSRDPVPLLPDLAVHRLQVGAVGVLYCLPDRVGGDERASQMRVQRIIDRKMAIVEMGYGDSNTRQFVLVTPTDGLADESVIEVGGKCYEVVGKGVFGMRTLFEVQPIDVVEFLKKAKAVK